MKGGFSDGFAVDPKNPRVEVVIEDYEGGPCYERIKCPACGERKRGVVGDA